MAQRTVQLIVGQILTDEEFRSDFLERPIETLTSLREKGFERTRVEVDALVRTDRRFWAVGAEWIDGRLQRCRLNGGVREGRHSQGGAGTAKGNAGLGGQAKNFF